MEINYGNCVLTADCVRVSGLRATRGGSGELCVDSRLC